MVTKTTTTFPQPRRIAVIDVGSGTLSLIISDGVSSEIVFKLSALANLARGDDGLESLNTAGKAIALHAVRRFTEFARRYNVDMIDVVFTAATRNAGTEGALFVERLRADIGDALPSEDGKRQIPVSYRILTGIEEAGATALAVLADPRARQGEVLIVDSGGGSTEFVRASNGVIKPDFMASIDLGYNRLRVESGGDLKLARSICAAKLSQVPWLERLHKEARLYFVGGGARNIFQVYQRQHHITQPLHSQHIRIDDFVRFLKNVVETTPDRLRGMGFDGKRLSTARESCLILKNIALMLGKTNHHRYAVISTHGLRDGWIIVNHLGKPPQNQNSTQQRAAFVQLSQRLSSLEERLLSPIGDYLPLPDPETRAYAGELWQWMKLAITSRYPGSDEFGERACIVCEDAWIGSQNREHKAYIAYRSIDADLLAKLFQPEASGKKKAFTERDIDFHGKAVFFRHHHKKEDFREQTGIPFGGKKDECARAIGLAARLAYLFSAGKSGHLMGDDRLRLSQEGETLVLHVAHPDEERLIGTEIFKSLARLAKALSFPRAELWCPAKTYLVDAEGREKATFRLLALENITLAASRTACEDKIFDISGTTAEAIRLLRDFIERTPPDLVGGKGSKVFSAKRLLRAQDSLKRLERFRDFVIAIATDQPDDNLRVRDLWLMRERLSRTFALKALKPMRKELKALYQLVDGQIVRKVMVKQTRRRKAA